MINGALRAALVAMIQNCVFDRMCTFWWDMYVLMGYVRFEGMCTFWWDMYVLMGYVRFEGMCTFWWDMYVLMGYVRFHGMCTFWWDVYVFSARLAPRQAACFSTVLTSKWQQQSADLSLQFRVFRDVCWVGGRTGEYPYNSMTLGVACPQTWVLTVTAETTCNITGVDL
jgi:hypothetical protein